MALLRRVLTFLVLLTPSVALGQSAPSEDACIAAYDAGQTQRRSGKLVDARRHLEMCAASSCPGEIARDCTQWLGEVSAEIPSIVVVATDPSGRDTLAVRVLRGDELLAPTVGVSVIELDPGEHVLRFEHHGAPQVERTVVLRVGQKNERVVVSFAAPVPSTALVQSPAPALPDTRPPEPASDDGDLGPLFWTGVVIAGLGLGVGAISGAVAIANKSDIDERCAVACTEDDIDAAAVPAHIATGGFVLLGVGAAIAVVGLFFGPSDRQAANQLLSFRF